MSGASGTVGATGGCVGYKEGDLVRLKTVGHLVLASTRYCTSTRNGPPRWLSVTFDLVLAHFMRRRFGRLVPSNKDYGGQGILHSIKIKIKITITITEILLLAATAIDDESTWKWEECEVGGGGDEENGLALAVPPFEDLWFAVRGGGGGTFGVVKTERSARR